MEKNAIIPPPPHNNNGSERGAVTTSGKVKKRFSIRYKLILIFGLLVALASTIQGLLAVRIARKAVTEKVETHLIDKAADTTEIIQIKLIILKRKQISAMRYWKSML